MANLIMSHPASVTVSARSSKMSLSYKARQKKNNFKNKDLDIMFVKYCGFYCEFQLPTSFCDKQDGHNVVTLQEILLLVDLLSKLCFLRWIPHKNLKSHGISKRRYFVMMKGVVKEGGWGLESLLANSNLATKNDSSHFEQCNVWFWMMIFCQIDTESTSTGFWQVVSNQGYFKCMYLPIIPRFSD